MKRWQSVLFCLTLAGSLSRADSTVAPAVGATAGIWQKHEYSFNFLGFTSTYSCDGLADKLRSLLIAAGARADAESQPGACSSGFGRPDKFARANLKFYTLVPSGSAAGSATPPVDGTWRSVIVARRSPQPIELGDCELIEQFTSNVLPLFSTRNVASRTSCIPHQESGSVIDLKFDAYVATVKTPAAVPPVAQSR